MNAPKEKNVLLVDDDKNLRKMLIFLFMSKGIKVEVSENGLDALEFLKRTTPDVIILDLMMPVMDGFEFLNAIKKDALLSELPVIVLSALPSSKNREKALSMGIYDYFDKPFKSSELANRTLEAIEKSKNNKCQQSIL